MLRFLGDPDLRSSLRQNRRRVAGAALAVVGRSLLGLAGPWYLGRGVDLVARNASTDRVLQVVLLLAAFSASTAFCQFWMRWLYIGWSRQGEQAVRAGLFSRLVSLPLPFHHKSRTGDLMSRLTSDVEAVRMGYGPGLMHAFQTGGMAIGALGLMLSRSVSLTLIACAPMLVLGLVLKHLMRRIHDCSTAVQEQQAALHARAQESFSGARVIKAFAREASEEERFAELSSEFRSRSVELARVRAWFRCAVELFGGLALVVVLLAGGRQVVAGALTVGDYAAFNGYLQMLVWPAIALGWTLSLFQRAEAAEARLQVIREVPAEARAGVTPPGSAAGEISIRHLTFTHEGADAPTLQDVSVDLPAGSSLGLVGLTGAGKSTLVSLLTRLVEPPPGTILLDGLCIRSWDLDALRSRIALVPQETFLFSTTIGRNVAFGVDEADQAAIAGAAGAACLEDAVASFPDGFDTRVGERGVTLSGGQRQRTAIARALLMQTPVLILDDAFSAVDTETEQRILERVLPIMRSRTTILVSHRVSTVRHADQILVLEGGRVAERGDHQGLLSGSGLYAEIHRLQQEAEELEQL